VTVNFFYWLARDETRRSETEADGVVDVRRGEYITGFVVRWDIRIYAIQVLTSLGRRSPFYGNPHAGSVYVELHPILPLHH
jgi:hypothetical protein